MLPILSVDLPTSLNEPNLKTPSQACPELVSQVVLDLGVNLGVKSTLSINPHGSECLPSHLLCPKGLWRSTFGFLFCFLGNVQPDKAKLWQSLEVDRGFASHAS